MIKLASIHWSSVSTLCVCIFAQENNDMDFPFLGTYYIYNIIFGQVQYFFFSKSCLEFNLYSIKVTMVNRKNEKRTRGQLGKSFWQRGSFFCFPLPPAWGKQHRKEMMCHQPETNQYTKKTHMKVLNKENDTIKCY